MQIEDLSIGFERYEEVEGWSSKRTFMEVIDKLNLSVHEGEIVAIVGAFCFALRCAKSLQAILLLTRGGCCLMACRFP